MLGLSDATSSFKQICKIPVTDRSVPSCSLEKERNYKHHGLSGRNATLLGLSAIVLSTAFTIGCSRSHIAPVENRVRASAISSTIHPNDQHTDLHSSRANGAVDAAAMQNRTCSIELYGDSILHGGYLGNQRLKEPPAAALRRMRPRYHVIDRTVNGETASVRAGSFENEVRVGRIVVIEHGLNDSLQNLPLEASLRAMILSARAEGRHVVLTGLSQTLGGTEVRARGDATVRKVATDLSIPFADWGSVPLRAGEMADVIHPAQAYSTRLVERLIQVLDSLSPECV